MPYRISIEGFGFLTSLQLHCHDRDHRKPQGKHVSLTLHLSPEFEQRLAEEAERLGLASDEYATRLIVESLPIEKRREALVALLQKWIDEPVADEEAGETSEDLLGALDQSHSSDRRLFPPDMKGITW